MMRHLSAPDSAPRKPYIGDGTWGLIRARARLRAIGNRLRGLVTAGCSSRACADLHVFLYRDAH
eukprot:3134180-Lingulodinium_polyedra.AAC.1